MKKRIISLILVVALSVLVLAGCGYSYEKDDLYQYAGTDKAALSKTLSEKLGALVIADGDFGHIESERQEYLINEIYERLAEAFADDKQTEGTPDGKDTVYYCYFATVEDTDEDGNVTGSHIIYASKMAYNSSSSTTGATSIQLGNEKAEGLEALIAAALAGKDVKDHIYSTDSSATIKGGETVYISYTKTVPKIDDNNNVIEGETEKITVTYGTLEIPEVAEDDKDDDTSSEKAAASADKSFAEQLIGKKAGSSKLSGTFTAVEDVNGLPDQTVTYSDVTIHFTYTTGEQGAIIFEATYDKDTFGDDYTKSKSEKDIFGESVKLDGKKITYNLFPVYFIDVNLDAASIIKGIYNNTSDYKTDFTADSFDCIKDLVASSTEINDLITGDEGLIALLNAYCAKDADEDDEKAVDEKIAAILAHKDAEGLADKIVAEYKQDVYDELAESYESEIKADLMIAIYKMINETIKLENRNDKGWYNLPEDAVQDAYDSYMNIYKYNFYEGLYSGSSTTDTSDDVYNYDQYNGDFKAYLKAALDLDSTATDQEIYDAIGEQAENDVRARIRIHLVADCLGITVSDDEFEQFKRDNSGYQSFISSGVDPADEDVMTALLAIKVYDKLLTVKDVELDDNNLNPVFENLTYTFEKDEDEDKDEDKSESDSDTESKDESDK